MIFWKDRQMCRSFFVYFYDSSQMEALRPNLLLREEICGKFICGETRA